MPKELKHNKTVCSKCGYEFEFFYHVIPYGLCRSIIKPKFYDPEYCPGCGKFITGSHLNYDKKTLFVDVV